MNINSVSFGSTYAINKNHLTRNTLEKIGTKSEPYGIKSVKLDESPETYVYYQVPNENDSNMTKMLSKLKVGGILKKKAPLDFHIISQNTVMKPENIVSRMKLSSSSEKNGNRLVMVNAEALSDLMENQKESSEQTCANSLYSSQCKSFQSLLSTGEPFFAPLLFGEDALGFVGRDKAVFDTLKKAGVKDIPMAMSQETETKARELGILSK